MNYLIPLCDCYVFQDKIVELKSNVKYCVNEIENAKCLVLYKNEPLCFVLDFNSVSKNILKVKYEYDNYFFLFKDLSFYSSFFNIKHKNNEIGISVSKNLKLFCNANLIFDERIEKIEFSHYEECGDLLLIYFVGKRNFVIALEDEKVCFANFYDECNVLENEKYFMCRLYDSLNHGKVLKISNNKAETYLAYLDNEELKLKNEFVPFVFLDCLLAGNFKYCNHLLNESLKFNNENEIKKFFPTFDYFYPINETNVILIKKNTLAGIYKFEVENCSITNICEL